MISIYGTVFIILIGSLNHFLYNWLNKSKLAAFFFAVNESTWEHIKLALGPSFLWIIVEYHHYYNYQNYFIAKFIALLSIIIVMPFLYYTIKILLKKSNIFIHISEFILTVVISQYIFNCILTKGYSNIYVSHIGIIGVILIFIMYMTLTYYPAKCILFKDPLTGKYGID